MKTSPPLLLPIFRSELQAQLLALLYLRPGRTWRLNELAEHARYSVSATHSELDRLATAGLVRVERAGRTGLYGAATESPLFEPLHQLIERTLGVEARLREDIRQLEGVEAAAIFGSWARGEASESSDIDVIVVGNVSQRNAVAATQMAGELSGREINVFVIDANDLRSQRQQEEPFIANVLNGPLTDLIGNVKEVAGAAP